MRHLRSFLIYSLIAAAFAWAGPAHAYWVWSPETGKWTNPRKAAKDTPEDQLDWAMQYFNNKDWDRAVEEFEKLPQAFPGSRLAAEGVYYSGLAWEEKKDPAKAADAYQRLIDRYPYSDRIKDAGRREFEIANQFAAGQKVKVLGMPMLPGTEKAIELYRHIVRNAPYGTYGDQAQFKIGELYIATGEYDEARKAFQAVVDEHPNSPLVSQARYEIARASMVASRAAGNYSDEQGQRAIEDFQGFKKNYPDHQQALEADASIQALRNERAKIMFGTAQFYDKRGKLASAKVYYQEVLGKYPETSYAAPSKKRVEAILQAESRPAPGPGVLGGVGEGVNGMVAGTGRAISGFGRALGIGRQDKLPE